MRHHIIQLHPTANQVPQRKVRFDLRHAQGERTLAKREPLHSQRSRADGNLLQGRLDSRLLVQGSTQQESLHPGGKCEAHSYDRDGGQEPDSD